MIADKYQSHHIVVHVKSVSFISYKARKILAAIWQKVSITACHTICIKKINEKKKILILSHEYNRSAKYIMLVIKMEEDPTNLGSKP